MRNKIRKRVRGALVIPSLDGERYSDDHSWTKKDQQDLERLVRQAITRFYLDNKQ